MERGVGDEGAITARSLLAAASESEQGAEQTVAQVSTQAEQQMQARQASGIETETADQGVGEREAHPGLRPQPLIRGVLQVCVLCHSSVCVCVRFYI